MDGYFLRSRARGATREVTGQKGSQGSFSKAGEPSTGRKKNGNPIISSGWAMVTAYVLSIALSVRRLKTLPRLSRGSCDPMASGHAFCEVTPTELELNFDAVFLDRH